MFLRLNLLTASLVFLLCLPALAGIPRKSCSQKVVEVVDPNAFRPAFAYGGKTVSGHRMDLLAPNLQLTDARLERMKNQSVLLVGEGYSDLLPHLLKHEVRNVRAIDPVYELIEYGFERVHRLTEFRDYLLHYEPYLIPMTTPHWPIGDASQDTVLSHLVVNNLNDAELDLHILEAARVLKPGGTAYLFGFSDELPAIFRVLKRKAGLAYETYEGSAYFESLNPGYLERRPVMGAILRRPH